MVLLDYTVVSSYLVLVSLFTVVATSVSTIPSKLSYQKDLTRISSSISLLVTSSPLLLVLLLTHLIP